MKKCSKCKIEKNESEFNLNNKEKLRLYLWCRSCQKQYNKEWYSKNKGLTKDEREVSISSSKSVSVNGVIYDSISKVVKAFRLSNVTIKERCNSEEYENYKYIDYKIPESKTCTMCRKIKIISEFTNKTSAKDGKESSCKECKYAWNKRWAEENKQIIRSGKLTQCYNINLDYYNELFKQQEGRCAICNIHQSELTRILSVDHNHETGEIRGLLCGKCNVGLGHYNDNIKLLKKAIDYLKLSKDDRIC